MVIDQGNYHIVDNDLKFTYSWEWTNLLTSGKSHLNWSVHFISNRSFKKRTYYESWQNSSSIFVLHVYVMLTQLEIFKFKNSSHTPSAPCITMRVRIGCPCLYCYALLYILTARHILFMLYKLFTLPKYRSETLLMLFRWEFVATKNQSVLKVCPSIYRFKPSIDLNYTGQLLDVLKL